MPDIHLALGVFISGGEREQSIKIKGQGVLSVLLLSCTFAIEPWKLKYN